MKSIELKLNARKKLKEGTYSSIISKVKTNKRGNLEITLSKVKPIKPPESKEPIPFNPLLTSNLVGMQFIVTLKKEIPKE